MTESLLPADAPIESETATPTPGTAPAPTPEEPDRTDPTTGIPETAEGYELTVPEALGGADGDLNRRLHAAGFSNNQTQLVYDLAQEYLTPILANAAGEFEAERQTERLVREVGGEAQWRETARQLLTWGKANLQPEVLDALGSTYEGVMAMRRMMQSGEPGLLSGGGSATADNENAVRGLMRDPRYWRDRDPAVVNQVTAGFERLYGRDD